MHSLLLNIENVLINISNVLYIQYSRCMFSRCFDTKFLILYTVAVSMYIHGSVVYKQSNENNIEADRIGSG